MIIRAELKCKQAGCEADPCAVDKVIELPSPRFKQFSRALLADYDFIAENKNAIRHDEDARHCLLILDAEGKDGLLVDPQGYNYARYSAFVPNARSLLTPDMGIDRSYLSPAEPWRDESRDEMLRMTLRVDGKPDYTLVLPANEEYLDAVKTYAAEFADLPMELEDFNTFTKAARDIPRSEVPKLKALLEQFEVQDIETAMLLTEHLADYILTPNLSSPQEAALDQLCFIMNREEAVRLIPYVNLFNYGETVIHADNAALTSYGLLHRADYEPMLSPIQQKQEKEMTMQ